MKMIRQAVILWLAIAATGCGPLFAPMTMPLSPEDQKQVDTEWDNMLTPVNRIDRQTLLDTIMTGWLFQLGVDRLHLRTEKYLAHGTVIMEADCDRVSPLTDEFTVTVLDDAGKTLRKERYSRADVEDSYKVLWGIPNLTMPSSTQPATTESATEPSTEPAPTTEQSAEAKRFAAERDRRMKAVEAATQPATLLPGR